MSAVLWRRIAAVAMLGALLWGLSVFPAYRASLALMLGAYAMLLWWRPALWMLVVPALLPVFDLAPWTGWFFFDEFDLLLLTTVAVVYWRLPAAPATARLTPAPWVKLGLLLLACSVTAASWTGMQPMPAIDADSFANYLSPYNSLRIAKGYAWALLLWPVMRRGDALGARHRDEHGAGARGSIERLFVPGMLLGLGAASLAVAWERMVFPGLFNFSSDYRPTAPFSAMHTGGAALDAYLAMAFPCLAFWLPATPSRWRLGLGFLLLLLGAYAGLTTFSRDVYLAYACSGALLAGLALARRRQTARLAMRHLLWMVVLLAGAAWLLYQVFGSSGYRGLGAALGLLGAATLLAGTSGAAVRSATTPATPSASPTPSAPPPSTAPPAPSASPATERHLPISARGAAPMPRPPLPPRLMLMALALLLVDLGLYYFGRQDAAPATGKGAYLAYLLSAALCAIGLLLRHGDASEPGGGRAGLGAAHGALLAAAAFPGLALSTALVAEHRAGAAARADIALLIIAASALPLLRRWRAKPLWRLHQRSVSGGVLCAVVLALSIPLAGSYYLGLRFSTVDDDAALRLRHWDEARRMMGDAWTTQAFGMGLGRYPATYLWHNLRGELPPTFSYAREAGNTFLRLAPPHYQAGYGEVLRMLQHVNIEAGARYRLTLDVRRGDTRTGLTVALCQRWLLYPQACTPAPLRLLPADGAWHRYSVELAPAMLQRRWPLRAPTQLEISAQGGRAVLDVDNLSLRTLATAPAGQRDLLANGDFERANAHWFFSSDHNHFPWHIKNFALNTLFETGWCGLLAMAMLLLALSADLLRRSLRGEAAAAVWLAALAGAMVVGLFDSITDVPRLTLLLLLLVFAAAPPAPPRVASNANAAVTRLRRRRNGARYGVAGATQLGEKSRHAEGVAAGAIEAVSNHISNLAKR